MNIPPEGSVPPPDQPPQADQWSVQPPPPVGPGLVAGPPVVVIGDITITATQVHTPSGSWALKDTQLTLSDFSTWTRRTPVWAIVLACVFMLCFFVGFVFLFIKEDHVTGSITIQASGPGCYHSTVIPVNNLQVARYIKAQVDYANSIAHAARTAV